MKIFAVTFWSGETRIMFAQSRMDLRRKLAGFGISEINLVEIV